MKPVTIKYRDGEQKIVSIRADSCSGVVPAHSDTYCLFYLNKVQVAKVAKSRLLPGYYDVYQQLYGRPWLKKLQEYTEIHLAEYDNWGHEIGGYPPDTQEIWMVNGDRHSWVIECKDRAILHIMNNDEVTRRGEFKVALKKLFRGKKIRVYYPTVHVVELLPHPHLRQSGDF